jgi:type IV secretory pathway VirB3-like protein
MFLGVPLSVFLVFAAVLLIPAMWAFAFRFAPLALALCVCWMIGHLYMKQVTRKDDQRVLQWMLRLRVRRAHAPFRRHWGTASFGPLSYQRQTYD